MIDLIYSTRPTSPVAFVAANMGVLIGCISTDKRLYDVDKYSWAFPISFIDNDFKKYNHKQHSEAVKFARPKYTTVRDAMTPQQCKETGIEYYELEQIIDWAHELAEHAQNVMVIPKYDCLDKIPEKFMLGYSVKTKYGGTPLPIGMFAGRNVHLLGGSFRDQLQKIKEADGSVVSIDNNAIEHPAKYGRFTDEFGKEQNSKFFVKTGHRPINLLISLSNMRHALSGDIQPSEKMQQLFNGEQT